MSAKLLMPLQLTIEVALFSVVGAFGTLLVALRSDAFSRFRQGFLLRLVISLLCVAIAGPFLIAVWTYEAAKSLLTHEIEQHLSDTGEVIKSGIAESAETALDQIENAAGILTSGADGRLSDDRVKDAIPDMRALNPLFLHSHVFDKAGRLVGTWGDVPQEESLQPAVRAVLAGSRYQRGPYYSAEFDRTLIQLGVPVRTADNQVSGVLMVQFDLESSIRKRFANTRFGKTGYVIVADSKGRIISHPDANRTHDSVSEYNSTRAALQGKDGFILESRAGAEPRYYFYRSIRNPAASKSEPLALLTELSQEEATGAARILLHRFLLVIAVVIAAALLVTFQVAGSVRRPVYQLLESVNRIRAGDLTARAHIEGADEIDRLGHALNDMAAGLQERDRIKDIFGRYVTTQVSEKILRQDLSLGGEARNVTVLFSDIRDFTSMSESMSPAEVVDFLNEYFSEMVDAVFEYGGVLDKYIGDGMMAVFGSLDHAEDHPARAVQTALRMQTHLARLNSVRAASGKPEIRIGIGIHTDVVVVGNIGSRKRLEYTAVGDGVNTASRLEGMNKQFGTTILISAGTYGFVKDRFECRRMPEAALKGKSKLVTCYEVLSARTVQLGEAAAAV